MSKRQLVLCTPKIEKSRAFARLHKRLEASFGHFDTKWGEFNQNEYDLSIIVDLDGKYIRNSDNIEAYAIITVSENPSVIALSALSERGLLFGGYRLCDLLKIHGLKAHFNLETAPLVQKRYANLACTIRGGFYYRPELYNRTVEELPRYGLNGVLVMPGGQSGTPVSRWDNPLVSIDGDFGTDALSFVEWTSYFDRLKEDELDIIMSVAPLVPEKYTDYEIDVFYQGGEMPERYLEELKSNFEKYLYKLFSEYPQLDGILFSATEGFEFGRLKRFFMDLDCQQYAQAGGRAWLENGYKADVVIENKSQKWLDNNTLISDAYLDAISKVCREFKKSASVLSHLYGINSEGIKRFRDSILRHPDIINIEDDFWNNSLWVHNLPVMNFLDNATRERVLSGNLGMMIETSDAEYYGGGTLANAYPDTMTNSALFAVQHSLSTVYNRINFHCRAECGTLFGHVAIINYASTRAVWSDFQSLEQVWDEFCQCEYGSAWYKIKQALQLSKTIILNAFQVEGVDLIVNSHIYPDFLYPGNYTYQLFQKSGRNLLEWDPETRPLYSPEYVLWQMGSKSVEVSEYLSRNERALSAAISARGFIDSAMHELDRVKYDELAEVFDNSILMCKTLRLIVKILDAANRYEVGAADRDVLLGLLEELKAHNEMYVKPVRNSFVRPDAYTSINRLISGYTHIAFGEPLQPGDFNGVGYSFETMHNKASS